MISVNYINSGFTSLYNNDDCYPFLKYLEESDNEILSMNVKYKMDVSRVLMERSIMGDDGSYTNFFEAENKNFVEKIGAALIELGKKFNEMIDKMIDKIKDFAFKFKSNEKKMDMLVKQHPELGKEKIKVLCDKGGLDFSDINNMAKLNSAFEDILRASKKGDIDPASLKGKWETAKKKILGDDYEKKGVVGAVAAVGTVLTVAVAVKKFKPEIADWKAKLNDIQSKEKVLDAEAYAAIKKDNANIENAGYASTILAINRERKQLHAKAIGQQQSVVDKIVNSIAKGIDSLVGSKAGKAILGDKSVALRTDLTNAADKDNARAIKAEYNKQEGIGQYKDSHREPEDRPADARVHSGSNRTNSEDRPADARKSSSGKGKKGKGGSR